MFRNESLELLIANKFRDNRHNSVHKKKVIPGGCNNNPLLPVAYKDGCLRTASQERVNMPGENPSFVNIIFGNQFFWEGENIRFL